MAHDVSGFDLTFTSRTSWKANRRYAGKLIDVVPVTWTKGRRQDQESGDVFQEVWYQNGDELRDRNASREPFVVAVAVAKDFSQHPHQFESFRALFEVVPTGRILSEKSIETKVIRRVTLKDMQHAPRT